LRRNRWSQFYRPARWSDAQILEEHAFTLDLAGREIPVVAPLVPRGDLARVRRLPLRRVSAPRRAHARTGDPKTLEWMGRFIGRIHAIGATRSFAERPALDPDSFGREPRAVLLARRLSSLATCLPVTSRVDMALAVSRAANERAGDCARCGCTATSHAGNVLWTTTDRIS